MSVRTTSGATSGGSSNSSDRGSSGDFSQAITDEYDLEPWDDFEPRIRQFAFEKLFPGAQSHFIWTRRMTGGSFNRVAEVGWHSYSYLVRVPRADEFNIDHSVAILKFLEERCLPVPRVITFDATADNTMCTPYTIQTFLPGQNLADVFEELTFEQRKRLAKEVGAIKRKMMTIKSRVGGHLTIPPGYKENPQQSLHVEEWGMKETKPWSWDYKAEYIEYWLNYLFWIEKKRYDEFDTTGMTQKIQKKLMDITIQMRDDGWLQDEGFCLSHQDLEPRNILVDLRTPIDCDKPIITGIVDWDSAVFVPRFAGCGALPTWVWDLDPDADYSKTRVRDIVGHTEEARCLKAIFDEAAGEEYVKYAYNDGWALARELVYFATLEEQFMDTETFQRLMSVLYKWREEREILKELRDGKKPSVQEKPAEQEKTEQKTLTDQERLIDQEKPTEQEPTDHEMLSDQEMLIDQEILADQEELTEEEPTEEDMLTEQLTEDMQGMPTDDKMPTNQENPIDQNKVTYQENFKDQKNSNDQEGFHGVRILDLLELGWSY